jgi:hypothetical protein
MNIIQCSCLGNFGGFGNQLFQYVFARSYAEKYGYELQIPEDWQGRRIFKNIDHSIIKKSLPKTNLDLVPFGKPNIDLFGYFQYQEAILIMPSLSEIREWLQFKDEYIQMFPKELNYYIACHVRRGDYISKYSHIYCNIAEIAYLEAVKKYNYDINKIFWVSDDFPKKCKYCEFDFLPDFFTLMNADVLFRSNSTFSIWASILGDVLTYAPLVNGKTGHQENVNFIKGNWPRCLSNYQGASPQKPGNFMFMK